MIVKMGWPKYQRSFCIILFSKLSSIFLVCAAHYFDSHKNLQFLHNWKRSVSAIIYLPVNNKNYITYCHNNNIAAYVPFKMQ